jgi:hypothetical protein
MSNAANTETPAPTEPVAVFMVWRHSGAQTARATTPAADLGETRNAIDSQSDIAADNLLFAEL